VILVSQIFTSWPTQRATGDQFSKKTSSISYKRLCFRHAAIN